jgi:glutamate racemase
LILEDALFPMIDQGIDTVVLGCTHYPFVIPIIQDIVGPEVRVIDPAPAVARQVERVLDARGLHRRSLTKSQISYLTTGDMVQLQLLLPLLIGETDLVKQVKWFDGELVK